MAVIIALGNDKGLFFVVFFPAVSEARRYGRYGSGAVKRQDWVPSKYSRICSDPILWVSHRCILQEAISSDRLQLYAVSIKSFSFHVTFPSLSLPKT